AAGVSDGDVRLFRSESFDSDPQIHSAASSVFKSQYSDSDNSFLVKQVDIVEFLMEMGDIGIVKIDAEGAEVPILESILGNKSLANRIGYIFAELHEALFPELSARYNALRDRCNALPHVNLNWP
ncbi:MAG: FkbM family methyltransferase, partial [Rhodobacteraceae bacterium]|nr:FkbM family methyltransferase [Paracoccaceae bacterium]